MKTEDKKEYLRDMFKKTRLARIRAERRFLEMDALLKHATIYYACITTVLSFVPLFIGSDMEWLQKPIAFLSIASAIVITICTTYASSENYALRAEKMRYSYLEIQRLWLELDDSVAGLEEGPLESRVDSIGERYVTVLQSTENHLEEDYSPKDEKCRLMGYLALRAVIYIVLPLVLGIVSWVVCS